MSITTVVGRAAVKGTGNLNAALAIDAASENKGVGIEEGEPSSSRQCANVEVSKGQSELNPLVLIHDAMGSSDDVKGLDGGITSTSNKGIADLDIGEVTTTLGALKDLCTFNAAISLDSGGEEGFTTPTSKDSVIDKGKAIAHADETLVSNSSLDKGKEISTADGVLISKGSWADKVRKSPPNEVFLDDKSEGSTAKVDTYNLRPQRPKRKGKIRKGLRPTF